MRPFHIDAECAIFPFVHLGFRVRSGDRALLSGGNIQKNFVAEMLGDVDVANDRVRGFCTRGQQMKMFGPHTENDLASTAFGNFGTSAIRHGNPDV